MIEPPLLTQIFTYESLPEDAKAAVDRVVEKVRQSEWLVDEPYRGGNIYAYPRADGNISFGINGSDGINIMRGLIEGTHGKS